MKKKIPGKATETQGKNTRTSALTGDFESLVAVIAEIHHQAQVFATKAVNVGLSLRNWLIGRQIVEYEQGGQDRAIYGERLIDALAQRLCSAGLKRTAGRELRRFRQFYLIYPKIWESVTPKLIADSELSPLLQMLSSHSHSIRESVTPKSETVETVTPQSPSIIFRLSFTHLAEIIALPDEFQRRFYMIECIRGNWSVRELRRQIASLYYERSGLSGDIPNQLFVSRYAVEMPNKAAMESFLKQIGREIGHAS